MLTLYLIVALRHRRNTPPLLPRTALSIRVRVVALFLLCFLRQLQNEWGMFCKIVFLFGYITCLPAQPFGDFSPFIGAMQNYRCDWGKLHSLLSFQIASLNRLCI